MSAAPSVSSWRPFRGIASLSYFPNLELQPITREILLDAAAMRARYRLRTPDAILVATGLQLGATAAVTNDEAWCAVPAIEALLLSEAFEHK